jgi:tetratricopeptide (TPR) repeat protein
VLDLVLESAAFCYENIDPARSIVLQIEQIEVARRLGAHHFPPGLANLGVSYRHMGLYRQARTALEQALELAEAFGARRIIAYCLMNLGIVASRTDDLRGARRLLERAVAEMSVVEDTTGRTVATFNLGHVLLELGDAAGAERRHTESRDLAASSGLVIAEQLSILALGRSSLAQGRLDEARQLTLPVWQRWEQERKAWPFGNQGLAYLMMAELFDALDEPDLERAVIEMGYRKLLEAAGRISDPEWRRSFLESHQDNRKLVEHWERLQ